MKTFKTIGFTEKEFKEFALNNCGIKIIGFDYDMGAICFDFEGDKNYENQYNMLIGSILSYFSESYVYIFTSDTDQSFPREIMIMFSDKKQNYW